MADVTAIQRSAVASFLRARLNEEAQAAHEAITHSGTAHFTVSTQVAAHIGRWDPARVLADVQAMSRVLDAYERALAMPDDDPGRPAEVGLELAVLALAQPYREHPHFHPAWYQ
jgi:hypothetical protein